MGWPCFWYSEKKSHLSSIIDDLEALAELRPLSLQEIEFKSQLNA
jgi:hypothetical protein